MQVVTFFRKPLGQSLLARPKPSLPGYCLQVAHRGKTWQRKTNPFPHAHGFCGSGTRPGAMGMAVLCCVTSGSPGGRHLGPAAVWGPVHAHGRRPGWKQWRRGLRPEEGPTAGSRGMRWPSADRSRGGSSHEPFNEQPLVTPHAESRRAPSTAWLEAPLNPKGKK